MAELEIENYALLINTDSEFSFRIETGFWVTTGADQPFFTPAAGDWSAGMPQRLPGAISAALVDDAKTLRIDFTSGEQICVPADLHYEAWTLTGPRGYLVVSMPGGELAIWSAR
ncbi:DUF6188 family protein [Nocardia sp. NPDC088792]|uniref:DUF6188 family protein n=1 Tax=Nocardia sp. NPDC088792 TaxID=3364332 RepID=UPI00381C080D